MIKVRIHFTMPDGFEDSLVMQADTLEELQKQAADEIERRGAIDPWSEEL